MTPSFVLAIWSIWWLLITVKCSWVHCAFVCLCKVFVLSEENAQYSTRVFKSSIREHAFFSVMHQLENNAFFFQNDEVWPTTNISANLQLELYGVLSQWNIRAYEISYMSIRACDRCWILLATLRTGNTRMQHWTNKRINFAKKKMYSRRTNELLQIKSQCRPYRSK